MEGHFFFLTSTKSANYIAVQQMYRYTFYKYNWIYKLKQVLNPYNF